MAKTKDEQTTAYLTLRRTAQAEIEEKKSVFIGYARRVTSEEEARAYIEEIRAQHPDARHHVFAYLLNAGGMARYSDDGEPQGTAGPPVLNVIKMNQITDACIVVVRYFGGILLGAGGLVRAYGAAARAAIEAAGIAAFEPYTEFQIVCSYADHQKLSPVLAAEGVLIDNTTFTDTVTLCAAVPACAQKACLDRIRELTAGRAEIAVTGCRMEAGKPG